MIDSRLDAVYWRVASKYHLLGYAVKAVRFKCRDEIFFQYSRPYQAPWQKIRAGLAIESIFKRRPNIMCGKGNEKQRREQAR